MTRKRMYNLPEAHEIVKLMAQGYSIKAACGELNFSYEAIHWWQKQDEEFNEVIQMGRQKRLFFLETQLISAMSDKKYGEVGAIVFALKNADPENWRDKSVVDVINTTVQKHLDLTTLSNDELAAFEKILSKIGESKKEHDKKAALEYKERKAMKTVNAKPVNANPVKEKVAR